MIPAHDYVIENSRRKHSRAPCHASRLAEVSRSCQDSQRIESPTPSICTTKFPCLNRTLNLEPLNRRRPAGTEFFIADITRSCYKAACAETSFGGHLAGLSGHLSNRVNEAAELFRKAPDDEAYPTPLTCCQDTQFYSEPPQDSD
jgi:hypothetical protein